MKGVLFQPGDRVLLLWSEIPATIVKSAGFNIIGKSYVLRLDDGHEMTSSDTQFAYSNARVHVVLRGFKEEMKAKGYTHISLGKYEGKLKAIYFKDHSQYNDVLKSRPHWQWLNYWVISEDSHQPEQGHQPLP